MKLKNNIKGKFLQSKLEKKKTKEWKTIQVSKIQRQQFNYNNQLAVQGSKTIVVFTQTMVQQYYQEVALQRRLKLKWACTKNKIKMEQ